MGKSMRERKRDAKKNLIAVLVVAAFGIAVFSINSVGKFIAEKVICPVVNLTAVKSNASTDKINAEPIEFYIVSLGSFDTDEEAANKVNENKSSSGYVLKNDGKYIAVYDCFLEQEQAEKVKNQNDMQLVNIKTASLSLKVTGTQDQIKLINSAFSTLNKTSKNLLQLNEEYEKGESSKLQTLSKLQKYKDAVNDLYSDVESLKSDNSAVKAISEMCACGKTILNELPKSNDTDFAQKVKYAAASFACEYLIFCNELG